MSNTEKRFIECYEQFAKDYINNLNVMDKSPRFKIMLSAFDYTPSENILDVGCGTGEFLELLGPNAIGLDISQTNIDYAKSKGLNAIQGNAESMPFENDLFNLIYCAETLEHVLRPDNVMDEIYRILKPGGTVIIVVPYNEYLKPYESSKYEFTHLRSFSDEKLNEIRRRFIKTKLIKILVKNPTWELFKEKPSKHMISPLGKIIEDIPIPTIKMLAFRISKTFKLPVYQPLYMLLKCQKKL